MQESLSVGDFLNNAQREQHELAKRWWWYARGLQALVAAISLAVALWGKFATELALLAAVLSIGVVIAQWMSDSRRSGAQAIHRKFEMLDALGWNVSQRELRNLHVSLPSGVKTKLDSSPRSPYTYFASKSPRSAKRLMENLTETTYFSQHLAKRSAQVFFVITALVLTAAIILLILALQESPTQTVEETTAKVVVSVLVFLFTAGFVRLTYEFYNFSQLASRIEASASSLCRQDNINMEEAIKLYHEYQIARAGAPLIPTQIWKWMRDELNKRWDQYEGCSDTITDSSKSEKTSAN